MAEEGVQDIFPTPPQPHFIRSQQKDELYLQLLTEACHDAVRRVLGPRGALRWAGETRAAAQLLYFALTTGSGLQTLGEEYCDMEQVAGPAGHAVPPGTVRRGLLVLLQAAGPYLADRLAQAAPGADDEEDGWAAWQRAQAAAAQLRQQEAAQPAGQQPAGAEASAGQVFLQQLALAAQQLRAAAQRAVQPVARRLPVAAALLRDHAATLLRLHLALFYIFGRYYQPSKRATGVRYLFLGRAFEGRPSYRVLGLLLCTQLGVSGVMWLARRYSSGSTAAGGQQAGGSAIIARHAAVLSEEGKPLPDDSGWAGAGPAGSPGAASVEAAPSGREVPSSRKCPLCLSARAHPTATPCGHVFCWPCIAEWGNQKPECPLCRAEFTPSSLVCVRHADF